MEREKILQALEEAFVEVVDPDEGETFAEFVADWNYDDEPAAAWVAETIIGAVENLIGRKFAWYWEPLHDDFNLTGEFAFVIVDPETRECLTFTEDEKSPSCAIVTSITNIDEAVAAVECFLSLIEKEGGRNEETAKARRRILGISARDRGQ